MPIDHDQDSTGNSLIEISDIFGLSQGIQKLVEFACSGIGCLYLPTHIRRVAKAQAAATQELAHAVANAPSVPLAINVNGESLELVAHNESSQKALTIEQRAELRQRAKRLVQQGNVEAVLAATAEKLMDEQEVPDIAPDSDWTARFFSHAEFATSEHMRELWSRVLSGQITRPGTFSLRTLDFLGGLSQDEAQDFANVAADTILVENFCALVSRFTGSAHTDIGMPLMVRLEELGLLQFEPYRRVQIRVNPGQEENIIVGNKLVRVFATSSHVQHTLEGYRLTKVGRELLELVEPTANMAVVGYVAGAFLRDDNQIAVATITRRRPYGELVLTDEKVYTVKNREELDVLMVSKQDDLSSSIPNHVHLTHNWVAATGGSSS